jgi:hypothetical protein
MPELPVRLQANKADSGGIKANNHDKGRTITNKDESPVCDVSVVDNRLRSSFIVLLLQPQAALYEGRRPLGDGMFSSRLHWVMQ